MANVLVVGEIKDGELKKISREITSAGRKIAKELGGKVETLLIGADAAKFAEEVAAAGADTVITANQADYNGEGYANLISSVVADKKPAVVLLPHSGFGKDYSPRVAVKTGSAIVADVVELKVDGGKVVGKKPIYSGKAYANIKPSSDIQMFTVRPNSQEVVAEKGDGATEEATADFGSPKAKITKTEASGGSAIQLAEAPIIVSGGRGMKGPENFKILQELCDILGAALGASRAAVDAGWIPHANQVGQTGKTVSPNCYIACGISGSIQHMAGMGSSKYIVAVNKDAEAPIFKVATYGVVADLFEVVPALTDEFKKVLG